MTFFCIDCCAILSEDEHNPHFNSTGHDIEVI